MSETHAFDKDGRWLVCGCSVTAHAFTETCPKLQTTLQSFVSPDPRPAMLTENDGPQTPHRPQSLLPDVNPPLPTTWACGCSVTAHSYGNCPKSLLRYDPLSQDAVDATVRSIKQRYYAKWLSNAPPEEQVAYNQAGQSLGKAAVLYCQGETDTAGPVRSPAELVAHGLVTQGIDTSDIPEAGEEWFKNAKLRQPRPEKRIA